MKGKDIITLIAENDLYDYDIRLVTTGNKGEEYHSFILDGLQDKNYMDKRAAIALECV